MLNMIEKRKQVKRRPKGEIKPFKAYSTSQVSQLLGIHPIKARNLATEMKAKRVGKEYLFLGENILQYLGSATFSGNEKN